MTAEDLSGVLDDDDYPAYTMGRAAEILGTTPSFLRTIGDARLITPLLSEGGHCRYQLRIAARARDTIDAGTPMEAACSIVVLEEQFDWGRPWSVAKLSTRAKALRRGRWAASA